MFPADQEGPESQKLFTNVLQTTPGRRFRSKQPKNPQPKPKPKHNKVDAPQHRSAHKTALKPVRRRILLAASHGRMSPRNRVTNLERSEREKEKKTTEKRKKRNQKISKNETILTSECCTGMCEDA